MSKYEKFERARAAATSNIAELLYVASACRLWLRESRRYGAVLRRRSAERHSFRRGRQTRWDWSSSGAPVMR